MMQASRQKQSLPAEPEERLHRPALAWLAALALAAVCLWSPPAAARQSWLMDWGRYHASAHGELSCRDCHDQASMGSDHPDAARVNQGLGVGFDPQFCYQCHDQVEADLGQGLHGRIKLDGPGRYADCLQCHDPHYSPPGGRKRALDLAAVKGAAERQGTPPPPPPTDEDQACLDCHGRPADKLRPLCLSCHGDAGRAGRGAPILAGGDGGLGPHQGLDCSACHLRAAAYPHRDQQTAACRSCHQPHYNSISGDAHAEVSCKSCHLQKAQPARPRPGGSAAVRTDARGPRPMAPHRLVDVRREESCRACHRPGAHTGASAMVLPPKGVLCLPCHAAVLSWGGWPSRVGLALFFIGLASALAFWLSGGPGDTLTLAPAARRTEPGPGRVRRLGAGLKALLLDGLLQRRLWRLSPWRGLIHGLIFWPLALRFLWGLAALLLGLWLPGSSWTEVMLGKNQPLTALFFDLTGLLMLTGGAAAMVRRLVMGRGQGAAAPARSDWLAPALLAGMILSGFATEAVRMAMTGWPAGSGFAFLGFAFSRLLPPGDWPTAVYGWLWYAHAGLAAAFTAYLPFSRMFHIILAPAVLALRAAGRGERP